MYSIEILNSYNYINLCLIFIKFKKIKVLFRNFENISQKEVLRIEQSSIFEFNYKNTFLYFLLIYIIL